VREIVTVADPNAVIQEALPSPSTNSAGLAGIVEQIARLEGRNLRAVWVEISAPFPIAGPVFYRDDFGEFRIGPPVHPHAGNDIFAGRGTPTVAPVDGTIFYENGGLGGLGWNLYTADNTRIFCTHLDAVPANVPNGSAVKRGQVIGFVGDSGNAAGGATHCHFEIHPGDGPAVNPKPYLDQWLAQAQANALARLQALGGTVTAAQVKISRRVSSLDRFVLDLVTAPGTAAQGGVALLAGLAPTAGALELAGSTAALAQVDWNLPQGTDTAADASVVRHFDATRAVAAGFTPPSLAPVLGLPSSATLRSGSHDIAPSSGQ
jgi:hypothetical protein